MYVFELKNIFTDETRVYFGFCYEDAYNQLNAEGEFSGHWEILRYDYED